MVTGDREAAVAAIEDRIERRSFGQSGATVVVEEYLEGQEVSLIAFTDGRTVLACEAAQDYKRVFDDDGGPNTGGMGAYSPVPACPAPLAQAIVSEVIEPTVAALAAAGTPFVGALYAGLALTGRGPRRRVQRPLRRSGDASSDPSTPVGPRRGVHGLCHR